MKILVISSLNVHLLNFLDLLGSASSSFEITVVSDNTENSKIKYPLFQTNFSLKNPIKLLFNIYKLSKIIKSISPSIIHIHQANSVALISHLAIKWSGHKPHKTILTTWGSDILIAPERSIILKQIVKYVIKKSDIITYDAKVVYDKILSLLPQQNKNKFKFFFYGIDVPKNIDVSKKENIIYSNRLHKPLYRIDKIITAFELFSKQYPSWQLVIAATGQETERLKKYVTENNLSDKVSFVGWIDKQQNFNWYMKAKIYVSIPESDAGSVSLIEAMASKCFCVASKIPANIELLTKESGYLVENVDEDFLPAAMNAYTIYFNAVETATKVMQYSKEEQTKNILSIYNSHRND